MEYVIKNSDFTVVIVDDEPEFRENTETFLEIRGLYYN